MTELAIETHKLRKVYNGVAAVQGLTLAVPRGEVFGFLGPNGAGKTTSIKLLLGLAQPTSGEANLLGRPLGDTATRARVGFLPEHFRFHDWLTATEFLRLHARLYHIPAARVSKRVEELLNLVGLAPHHNKKLREFSKGMLQRIGLAQALLNEPELIFLDEPTSGLDPVGRRLVRDIIRAQKQRGATVFLNSHLLSEIEITCDRVAFIKHGEVVALHALQGWVDGQLTVELRCGGLTEQIVAGLATWATGVRVDGELVRLNVASEGVLPELVRYLVEQGAQVYALVPQRLSLEELFIQIIGTEGGL